MNSTELIVSPKQRFADQVKQWAIADAQLDLLHQKTKQIRQIKTQLTEEICAYMNEHHASRRKIGVTDGELCLYEKKEYSALTYGYVEQCLAKLIENPDSVAYIMKYLKENREITTTTDIRKKPILVGTKGST